METNYDKLIRLFESKSIKYEILEHIEEGISAKIAEIRGNKPEEGCKSILLRWKKDNDKGYILANVPGSLKVNLDKVKELKGYKEIRMADPTELMNQLGCRIGEVPPFGELFGIDTIIDNKLLDNERLFFNAATLSKSIKINIEEFKRIIENNNRYLIEDISV